MLGMTGKMERSAPLHKPTLPAKRPAERRWNAGPSQRPRNRTTSWKRQQQRDMNPRIVIELTLAWGATLVATANPNKRLDAPGWADAQPRASQRAEMATATSAKPSSTRTTLQNPPRSPPAICQNAAQRLLAALRAVGVRRRLVLFAGDGNPDAWHGKPNRLLLPLRGYGAPA